MLLLLRILRLDSLVCSRRHRLTTLRVHIQEQGTLSDELTYCLRRLVRGLASSRQGARQGFALVLTELMRAFEEVEVQNVLDIMEETMAVTGMVRVVINSNAYLSYVKYGHTSPCTLCAR